MLSRPLTADEKFCYAGGESEKHRKDQVCIEGGIIVWDTYDDHLYGEPTPSNEMVAFVFRSGETEKRLTARVESDECITPGRTIRIAINTAFISSVYGYTIDSTERTVRIHGNDDDERHIG